MSGMDNPSFDVLGFLDEPGRPASVATVTDKGHPALATMWFTAGEDRLWFHTPDGGDHPSPFLRAAAGNREVAVMIATFDPPDDVRQVRMTGPARLEARDDGRVRCLYSRYVSTWTPTWETQAISPNCHLWSMSPQRGMAVAYPDLKDSPTFRWSEPSKLFDLRKWAH